MRVVRDDARGLVAWLAPGTEILRPVLPDGRDLREVAAEERYRAARRLRRSRWRGNGVLRIAPRSRPWSIWLFWNTDWQFEGWYVNLEDIHERGEQMVVTQDRVLDVVVAPDGSVTRKDEDELDAAVATGRFSPAQADEFRRDAAEVERVVARRSWPFDEPWPEWRPAADWGPLGLPPDATWDFADEDPRAPA